MDNTAKTYRRLHHEVTALRQQLTQFEAIAASLHDAVYVVNLEGRITYCNRAWARLTGYRMEELLGRPSLECYAGEAAPVFLERRRCALAGMPVSPLLETVLVKRDGTRVPVELSVTNFVFDGRLTGRIAVARDITRREEEQFQGFLEGVPDATVVVDEDGMIVRVNTQTEVLFGYSRGELLDQRVEILLPERFRAMHGAHRAHYFRESRVRPMGMGLDLYGLRKDGHEFPVEISLSPLKTEQGVLVLGAIRDITVRKQMEETLREREEFFRKAFEEGPVGMAIIDASYRFVRVNARLCRMLGYTEPELMARTFVDVTHPEDIDADVRLAERVFQGHIPHYDIEKRYLKKTGEVLWIHLSASVVRDVNGRLLYGLAMIEDITARKQAEEAMRLEREKLKVTLTSIGDAVIATDTSGVITFINAVAEGLTGWPAHEAIGSPLGEVFRILHEQTRQPIDSPVPEVLRQRRIVELAPHGGVASPRRP